MISQFRTRYESRKGASLLTYGLLTGLIAVVALGSVTSIGSQTNLLFGDVSDSLSDSVVASGGAGGGASPTPTPSPASSQCDGTATVTPSSITGLTWLAEETKTFIFNNETDYRAVRLTLIDRESTSDGHRTMYTLGEWALMESPTDSVSTGNYVTNDANAFAVTTHWEGDGIPGQDNSSGSLGAVNASVLIDGDYTPANAGETWGTDANEDPSILTYDFGTPTCFRAMVMTSAFASERDRTPTVFTLEGSVIGDFSDAVTVFP